MGGSFLGGWLAGDLATRGPDRGDEADSLRNQLNAERHQADLNHGVSMAAVGAVMNWKTTTHILRARLNARRETEEELLEQLTAADVRVPLCDPDAFEDQYTKHYAKALTDPTVIEETFENGNLPQSAVELIEDWKKEKGIE